MPFDSNGNYTLPTSYFVENGDTVLPIQHNPPFEDVAQALSASLLRDGRAPMSGDLKMGGKKIINLADAAALTDAVTKQQLDALAAIVADPWGSQPIGSFIHIDDGTVGFTIPPKDKAYRYVELTAGLTGAGAYNEGILTTETVTGSAPNIVATALVSLSGSPFDGRTLRLINTERRFLRPGAPGTLESSQNLSHGHGVNDPGHVHGGVQNGTQSTGRSTSIDQPPAVYSRGNTEASGTGIWLSADGGNESRPRNIGIRVFRRIK